MTDNEITREKTFSEELPYFKERIKEVFDNYHNPNGNEDPLHISVLRDSYRIVRKAEEEITRQKAEIEKLKGSTIVSNIMESQRIKREAKAEAIKKFATKFLEKIHEHHYLLTDPYNSKDYGMFTTGIEQAVNETKKEMMGEE